MTKPKPPLKEYKTYWIDDEGVFHLIDAGESMYLQHACFNMICELITLGPTVFTTDTWDNMQIIKNIRKGNNPHREHWFSILGDQVISTIEIPKKQPRQ